MDSNNNNNQPNLNQNQGPQTGASGSQQEDYLDKGLDALEKKFGQDPTKLRSTNEKITDFARGQFEKLTGKHIPDKFSN